MDSQVLTDKVDTLRREAFRIGFDGFGVARPETAQAGERFQQWLDLDYDGEMAYMGRWNDKRRDMSKVLPDIQSVICLRSNYFTAKKDLGFLGRKQTGDVSLYALNEDYHHVLTDRLKELEEIVKRELPDCNSKIYVDTGPILEKPLAQNAGLGWIGKHTNLLTEGEGSWYFLSEILLDVALPPSKPAVNRCGTCRECIDICPTRAIVAPYVLDSRRCISYLTIELKGAIPVEFRKAIGNRVYGCDDCQIVCPWNSYAVATKDNEFYSPGETWELVDLIRLDEEQFRERFRRSPIKRLKRRGFLRNVAVALGNCGDPKVAPYLIDVLADEEPLIRAHAVWALGELLGQGALDEIDKRLADENDALVLEEVRQLKTRYSHAR